MILTLILGVAITLPVFKKSTLIDRGCPTSTSLVFISVTFPVNICTPTTPREICIGKLSMTTLPVKFSFSPTSEISAYNVPR